MSYGQYNKKTIDKVIEILIEHEKKLSKIIDRLDALTQNLLLIVERNEFEE
jgi:uncharacterized coiled-coil protein SlyX